MQVLYFLIFLAIVQTSVTLNPLLLVPGDGGSILRAMYTKPPPHYICGSTGNWFIIWLNLFYLTPLTIDCFVETIRLEYDPITRKTFSPDFCETKVDGFGTSDSVEYFSGARMLPTSYFYYLVTNLVNKLGYVRNKSIRGAPYDFRRAPNEMKSLSSDMKALIEEMYAENSNSPVVIIAHSLGNMFTIELLNSMSQVWKDTYIKSFISISPPYAGAVDALRTAISGNDEHIKILSSIALRGAQSTWPSTYYLMPEPGMFTSATLVATRYGNYSASSLSDLLESSEIKYAKEHLEDSKRNKPKIVAPNVPVHCVYTEDMPTAEFLDYRTGDFPNDAPTIRYGLGDGTVNLESLRHCTRWENEQEEVVKTHIIPGVKHLQIMRDDRLFYIVSDILTN